jgi:hypothetical protein
VLAARGEQPAQSLTLLTTLLDFADTGVLDIFIDEASVQLREMTIGAGCARRPGLLKGKELATTFSFLRPNDLVWNYVVGNYLKGEAPPPFDLLYWNGDATNLPGPMYCWYLRHTYLRKRAQGARRADRVRRKGRPGGDQGAGVHLRLARRPHRALDGRLRSVRLFKGKRASCWARRATSPASSTRRPRASAATGSTTSCRPRPQEPGSPAPPNTRAAGGPTGATGSSPRAASWCRAQGAGQRQVQAHRAGTGPLRQGQGLSFIRS